jgi:gas vesicle protein
MQAMQPIKSIVKCTFLWAFFLGFIGLWVGAVAALIIWPELNLGPPAGALYGIFIGVWLGAVLGFVLGIIRSQKSRAAHEDLEKTERAH